MPKRLFWMTTGYVSGAASSWWVQRKVKREVERVMPSAVRTEVANRVQAAGDKALVKTVNSPVAQGANRAVQRIRPDVDLTDRATARIEARRQPSLNVVDGDLTDQPGVARLRNRARKFRPTS